MKSQLIHLIEMSANDAPNPSTAVADFIRLADGNRWPSGGVDPTKAVIEAHARANVALNARLNLLGEPVGKRAH